MPQRHLEQRLRIGPALRRRQVTQRGGAVDHDPQRPPGVLRHGEPGLPGPVGGDQPALRLPRGPLQRGAGARGGALHGDHAVAPGEAGVLAGGPAVHDQHVAVAQRLQGDAPQQRRRAAAGGAERQQVRLGGAGPGAPHHRRHVAALLALAQRERAGDLGRVGEAEDRLARRGDERLRREVRGQRRQHLQGEPVRLLVPDEPVLAPAPGLGVQQLLDPGARLGLAVGEVGGITQHQPGDPAGVVELVGLEGALPLPAVRVEGRGILGGGEVGDQRLVQRRQAPGLVLVRGARGPAARAVAALPRGRRHGRGGGQHRAVGRQHDHQQDRRHQEQQGTAPVLRHGRPPSAGRRGQPAQPAGHRDQRMEHVGGPGARRPGQLPAAGDACAAVGQDAGEGAPGH